MDWAKTTARGYKNHLSFVFGATYARGFTVVSIAAGDECVGNIMQVVFGEIPFTCITSAANSLLPLNNLGDNITDKYCKTSSISRTKSPNLNASRIVLWLSSPNPLKPFDEDVVGAAPTGYIWVINNFIVYKGATYYYVLW